ncbi:unnamed protein product [Cylindrotheca closterium]|uniref:DUF2256 domain-containing protein n=1 Tax=Cylindrotheca closterium TaxID=2856 RepID=A0AAD2FF29_9STRA|nr:unnamed protein product [Cylindrotheca closterium]
MQSWKGFSTFLIASQILKSRPSTAFFLQTKRRYSFQSSVIQSGQSDAEGLPGGTKPIKRSYTATPPINMPRGVKKENLPSKVCVVCNRPFTWRKKWERVWDEVTTCSKSCNHKRRAANRGGQKPGNNIVGGDASGVNGRVSPSSMGTQEVSRRSMSTDAAAGSVSAAVECTVVPTEQSIDRVTSDDEMDSPEQLHFSREIADQLSDTDEPFASLMVEDDFMKNVDDPVAYTKQQRKALKKAKKAERRAQRQGRGDPTAGQKTCDMCGKSVNLLIRCMYEPGQADWKMVCGKCWKIASGGVVDGDKAHPHYRYGGLWKNRRAQS